MSEDLRAALADRYAIERELGRGGMATVYLARDIRHKRPVALKVLHAELVAGLGPGRFEREIEFAARLQHPHILTVLDSGSAPRPGGGPDLLWFTMPYVEGESLRARLRRERQLPVEDALRIVTETARALDYAHRQGVVHRDIKPENILLTVDGDTLVADFGIARALSRGENEEQLTETGLAVGTPAYMSPEQSAGDKGVDARTDVYSLGAVLYELLAGEPPFTGPTTQALLMKRLTEPPPSVRSVRPNVPAAVDDAIRKALAPVAADRFGTVAQLAGALQPTAGVTAAAPAGPAPTGSPASAAPSARRRPMPVLAVTLIAGFLLGLGVLFAWRSSRHGGSAGGDGGARVLAVLPFENMGDSSTDYFAEGVTDAVRGKLSSLPGLQVIASTSSNEYKDSGKPLPVIARELEADYLLIARIRWGRAGDGSSRVKVSPELVDVGRGGAPKVRWQQPFDAELTDVFTVQAEIADQVASALDLALGTGQKEQLSERPTQNLAAYDAFLKGEAAGGLTVADAPSLRAAINYYEQAVALDSTFAAAWAALGRAQGAFYYNVMPVSEAGEAAKVATDRSIALAPARPDGWVALCEYYQTVAVDYERALEACRRGLAITPENSVLLTAAALSEQGLGRWDEAVRTLEKARKLDPRSALTARRLAHTLLRLRRYPEALAAGDRGLAVSPENLDLIENKTMIHLARGDLEAARRVISNAPAEVEPTALVTFFGNYWDLAWVLDDSHQRLLLRLPPSAFDGDRGTWGIVRAQTYFVRGDTAAARVYADSARIGFERTLENNPDDPQRRILLGLALAYRGSKAQAIREGERGVALLPDGGDGYTGPYLRHQLMRIYLLAGEEDKALDQLEALLRMPYYLSPGWLRVDPTFDQLRKHPRFQRLVAAT